MEVMDRVMLLRDIWYTDNADLTDLLYWALPVGRPSRESVKISVISPISGPTLRHSNSTLMTLI